MITASDKMPNGDKSAAKLERLNKIVEMARHVESAYIALYEAQIQSPPQQALIAELTKMHDGRIKEVVKLCGGWDDMAEEVINAQATMMQFELWLDELMEEETDHAGE